MAKGVKTQIVLDADVVIHFSKGGLLSRLDSTPNSRNCMKDKSHPKVTFKWSRVDEGLLLSAFSAPVHTGTDPNVHFSSLEST